MDKSEVRYCKRVASSYFYTINSERYNVSEKSNKELFDDYIVLRELKNKIDTEPYIIHMLNKEKYTFTVRVQKEIYKSYFTVARALKIRGFKIKEAQ